MPVRKIFWYIKNLGNLFVVCLRLSIYCIVHPKELLSLLFSFFSILNEFYQVSHGKLRDFRQTKIFQGISQYKIFARSNIFNADSKTTRSNEVQVLSALVCYFEPGAIFEIGTYNGFTSLHFAINSPDDCVVYTLDLPPDFNTETHDKQSRLSYDDMLVMKLSIENANNRIYHKHPQGSKIKELFGDSSRFDFSPYYGKMDMVFIDGNHSYEFVKSDTEQAMKMLSERGVIVWHDFDYIIHQEVFKYLNGLSDTYKIYSIPHTRFAIYGRNLA